MTSLIDQLRLKAQDHPERRLVTLARSGRVSAITYREGWRRAQGFGSYLISEGLQPGQGVFLMGEPSIDWVVALLGIMASGGVILLMPSQGPAAVLRQVREQWSPWMDVISEEAGQAMKAQGLARSTRVMVLDEGLGDQFFPQATAEEPLGLGDGSDTAAVVLTGGGSEGPRPVALSNSLIMASILGLKREIALREDDVYLAYGSNSSAWGIQDLALVISSGATLALTATLDVKDYDRDVRALAPSVIRQPARTMALNKVMMNATLRRSPITMGLKAWAEVALEDPPPSGVLGKAIKPVRSMAALVVGAYLRRYVHSSMGGRLRACLTLGGSVSPALIRSLSTIGVKVHESYGLTEGGGVVAIHSPRLPKGWFKALPGAELSVHGEQNIVLRYLSLPGQAIPTGDSGRLNGDGLLRFLNPADAPQERHMESLLRQDRFIQDAVVFHHKGRLIALIFPNFYLLAHKWKKTRLTMVEKEAIVKNPIVKSSYGERLGRILGPGSKNKVDDVIILTEKFLKGKSTHDMRLRRKEVIQAYIGQMGRVKGTQKDMAPRVKRP